MTSGDPQDTGHYYIQADATQKCRGWMVSRNQEGNDYTQAQSKKDIPYSILDKSKSLEFEREHGQIAYQQKGQYNRYTWDEPGGSHE